MELDTGQDMFIFLLGGEIELGWVLMINNDYNNVIKQTKSNQYIKKKH